MRSTKQKNLNLTYSVLVSMIFLITACGGDGGGGGPAPNRAPSAQASATASKAIFSALGVAQIGGAAGGGGGAGGAGSTSETSFKGGPISKLNAAVNVRQALGRRHGDDSHR